MTHSGIVSLWDVGSGRKLAAQPETVSHVAFAADGKRFTTVGVGNSVLVWEVAEPRRPGAPVLISFVPIGAMAVGPDGVLVVGSDEGVTLSTIDPATWRKAACRVFGRNLTKDEWKEFIGPGRPYAKTCAP